MSMEQERILKCPKCGKDNKFTIWQSLNTGLDPEKKQQLISGALFRMECTECGTVTNVNYPILYHDMPNGLMIHYVTEEKEVEEVISAFEGMKNAQPGVIGDDYQLRIVTNVNSLREKAYIFDLGLDDRVIELMKLMIFTSLYQQFPDKEIAEILLDINEGEPENFAVRQSDGQWFKTGFIKEMYEILQREFDDYLKADITGYIVDFVWAKNAFESKSK